MTASPVNQLKLAKRALSLFLAPAALLFLLYSPWSADIRWALFHNGDEMEKVLHGLAGWRAQDCGRVKITDDSRVITTDHCAIEAFEHKRAFRVRYDYHQGGDDAGSMGMVGDSAGRIYMLRTSAFDLNEVIQFHVLKPGIKVIQRRKCLDDDSAVMERFYEHWPEYSVPDVIVPSPTTTKNTR